MCLVTKYLWNTLGQTKLAYIINFGKAPYLHEILNDLEEPPYFFVLFGKILNGSHY